MKRTLLPIAFLGVALGGVAALQVSQRGPRTGYAAPDFALPDLKGATHRLSDYRGKIVLVNLWATWCPPCREEMPGMEQLFQRLRGRDFVMLAIAEDEGGAAAVGPFVGQMGLTFPVLLDPDARLSPRFGVTGYPETFILDRSGNVVNHIIGPAAWESEAMMRYFNALLEPPAAPRPDSLPLEKAASD